MNTSDTLLVIINCHRLVSLLFCLVKHPLLAVGISRSGLIVLLFTVGVENFSAVFFRWEGTLDPVLARIVRMQFSHLCHFYELSLFTEEIQYPISVPTQFNAKLWTSFEPREETIQFERAPQLGRNAAANK